MKEQENRQASGFLVYGDEPLIGVIAEENGQEVIVYFTEEQEVAAPDAQAIQAALQLAGVWSDLNWQEMEQALDQIRHEAPPSPPLAI